MIYRIQRCQRVSTWRIHHWDFALVSEAMLMPWLGERSQRKPWSLATSKWENSMRTIYTPPRTNIALKHWWLKMHFLLRDGPFFLWHVQLRGSLYEKKTRWQKLKFSLDLNFKHCKTPPNSVSNSFGGSGTVENTHCHKHHETYLLVIQCNHTSDTKVNDTILFRAGSYHFVSTLDVSAGRPANKTCMMLLPCKPNC